MNIKDKIKEKNIVRVSDIKFYLIDEDGNESKKEYRLKPGIRFKPLEYLCESVDPDILEICTNTKPKK
jgi:hypothetical protein